MSSKSGKRGKSGNNGGGPSLPGRGLATAQDILAWVAALYTVAGLLLTLTSVVTGDIGTVPLWPAIAPVLIGLSLLLIALARKLPSGAYSLKTDLSWWRVPLYLVGALALPAIATLHLRRRSERTTPERWLHLPRWVGVRMAVVSALALLGSSPTLLHHWPLDRVLENLGLSAALSVTMILIGALGIRTLARRELLLSPTVMAVSSGHRSVSRMPLGILVTAIAGLTLSPLLAAHLWLGHAAKMSAEQEALALADRFIENTQSGHDHDLGTLLAAHPEVGVRSSSGTLYGTDAIAISETNRAQYHRVRGPGVEVVVPVSPARPPPILPLGLLTLVCLTTGAFAARDLLRRVDGDTLAAAAALAEPYKPTQTRPQTLEWSNLQPKIDALRARIDRTTKARDLAEQAVDETDRSRLRLMTEFGTNLHAPATLLARHSDLLSQELALRSPLQQECLRAIAQGIHRLDHTLTELIDMAALAQGELILTPEPLAVDLWLAAAISRARARRPALKIDLRTDPDLPPLCADSGHLTAALASLIAFASGELEGRPLTISATYDPALPLGLRITLSAPVRPMSEVEANIARRPFHRLAGQPALGQDLARAEGIIRLSKGRLELQAFGEGMRFTVDLPASRGLPATTRPPDSPPRTGIAKRSLDTSSA